MSEWTLADELDLQPVVLSRAALLCAQATAYPQLDISLTMAKLADLAAAAGPYVPDSDPVLFRGVLLAEFLFGRLQYAGNRENYADPRNSFLNEVVDRKLGIPISLSILYLGIAQRLGIPAYGVGLPGHFIVGVDGGDEQWYLDPFNGGGRLSLNECARLVESTTGYQGPFQAHWLSASDPGEIMARLLHNLRAIYAHNKQWDEAVSVIELLRLVQPGMPEHLRDLGLIHHQRGATNQAAGYLEAYLQQAPEAEDAQTIRLGMADVLDDWVRLN